MLHLIGSSGITESLVGRAMYYWFSAYTGNNWTPNEGYNGTFKNQVVLLRKWFRLQKAGTGQEKGTGYWHEYRLRGQTVYITVDSFTWDGYSNHLNELDYNHYLLTPVFKLNIRIAKKPGARKVILTDQLTIKFPSNYPAGPPAFYTTHRRGSHVYGGGWMCILGHGQDWNPNRDTIISGINAAFDLLIYNTQHSHNDYY